LNKTLEAMSNLVMNLDEGTPCRDSTSLVGNIFHKKSLSGVPTKNDALWNLFRPGEGRAVSSIYYTDWAASFKENHYRCSSGGGFCFSWFRVVGI
jgi:hypothetical protein